MKNIKDKIMEDSIIKVLLEYKNSEIGLFPAKDRILSLMGENTEGVSTSLDESGDLHEVSDRNASRSDSAEGSKKVVGGTLALRTDDRNFYCMILDKDHPEYDPECGCWEQCSMCRAIEMESS